MLSHRLGKVELEPEEQVTAGIVGQWTLIYTVGSYGIDEGGTIKISQRFASDWQEPQFEDPEKPGYTTVWTDGDAKLNVYFSKKANERPWMKCLVIDVFDGSLKPGEVVKIVLGDQRYGSPGIRAQTFQEAAHEFRFLVDPTNACVTEILPSSPIIQIVHGEILSLCCIVPTQTEINQNVEVYVAGVDAWGNPTPPPEMLSFSWQGTGEVTFYQSHMSFIRPGSGYVVVESEDKVCNSNPITGYEHVPNLRKFWGDLHAQSDTTVGTGTLDEYFQFARDKAKLDFCSHQGNDFQVTDDMWSDLNSTIEKYNLFLDFANKPIIKNKEQYENAADLHYIRNHFVHYKPEWDSEKSESELEKRFKKLEKQIPFSPYFHENNPYFPRKCFTYSFAQWAVNVAVDYIVLFNEIVGIDNNMGDYKLSLG